MLFPVHIWSGTSFLNIKSSAILCIFNLNRIDGCFRFGFDSTTTPLAVKRGHRLIAKFVGFSNEQKTVFLLKKILSVGSFFHYSEDALVLQIWHFKSIWKLGIKIDRYERVINHPWFILSRANWPNSGNIRII